MFSCYLHDLHVQSCTFPYRFYKVALSIGWSGCVVFFVSTIRIILWYILISTLNPSLATYYIVLLWFLDPIYVEKGFLDPKHDRTLVPLGPDCGCIRVLLSRGWPCAVPVGPSLAGHGRRCSGSRAEPRQWGWLRLGGWYRMVRIQWYSEKVGATLVALSDLRIFNIAMEHGTFIKWGKSPWFSP